MSDQDNSRNGQGGINNESPKSVMIIEFAAPGSAQLTMNSQNVTPAQMLAAAAWLDWFARRAFDQMQEQAMHRARIAVPGAFDATKLKGKGN